MWHATLKLYKKSFQDFSITLMQNILLAQTLKLIGSVVK